MNAGWLSPTDSVVLASRARLARAVEGLPFRGALHPGAAREFRDRARAVLGPLGFAALADDLSLDAASRSDALEIPSDILGGGAPWLALRRAGTGVLVFHNDHLRGWAVRPGADLVGALQDLVEVESDMALLGPFAEDPEWGWRTASPEDVGTGLRASSLLFVPALWLSRRLSNLSDGLDVLGGRMRSPWHGEPLGPLATVANRVTLGRSELDLARDVERWTARVVQEEERAARDLVEHWGGELRDSVHRSDAVLGSARLLSGGELQQRAALVGLGARLGWLGTESVRIAVELLLETRSDTLRLRRPGELAEGHPHLDDLRASETRALWGRARA